MTQDKNNSRYLQFAAVLLITISSGLVFFNTRTESVRFTNPGSRYATVEALVHHQTFAIDNTRYVEDWSIDKVKIGDHFYSSKPPMLPVMTAGVYRIYRAITGKTIIDNERDTVRACNWIMIGIPHILLLIYLYRFSFILGFRQETTILLVAAGGFSYLGVGYSGEMNNHSPAAAIALIAFYCAYRARNDIGANGTMWLAAGFFCGLLPTIDVPSGIISAGLAIYLMSHDWKRSCKWFLPAALPPILLHLLLTKMATGSVIPIYLRPDLYGYAGSYWMDPKPYDALSEPKHIYAFHTLFGHHGILSMNPALILAGVAMIRIICTRSRLFAEATVVTATSIGLVSLYIWRTNNYGGLCVGFRWLIVIMPLLLIFFAAWFDRSDDVKKPHRLKWTVALTCILVGQFHVIDALDNPWKKSKWQTFVESKISEYRSRDSSKDE